jgi:hypothetical protein
VNGGGWRRSRYLIFGHPSNDWPTDQRCLTYIFSLFLVVNVIALNCNVTNKGYVNQITIKAYHGNIVILLAETVVIKSGVQLRAYQKSLVKKSLRSSDTSVSSVILVCCKHRISIPAYAIEQQWWQLGVFKNEMSLMSFIYKMMLVLYQSGVISGYISNIYWHASKWSSISFSHWQCPWDREFSLPRFVGLLILSLWLQRFFERNFCITTTGW